MTHKQLVEIAYKWLLKNGGVGVALKELKSVAKEIPDVIGFDSWQSIVIECKISRSDFFSDKKKPHREKGMGNWRFYCCPKGLIKQEELPEKWGLIYVNEKGKAKLEYDCRVKRVPNEVFGGYRMVIADDNKFEADIAQEKMMMYSALRRLFIKGYVKHIYDKKYQYGKNINEIIELNQA